MRPTASRLVVVLLSLIATLLLVLILVLIGAGSFGSSAMAQGLPAENSPRFVVTPAQLSGNVWGCYVVDTTTQTLCVYQYSPGEKLLKLAAARGISQDTQLRNFNTSPPPAEVEALVQTEQKLMNEHRAPATQSGPAGETGRK